MLRSHEIAGTIILRTARGTGTWPAGVPPTPWRLVVMVLTALALPSRFRAWVPAVEAAPPAARVLDMGEIRGAMRKARGQVLFVHLWASWCGPCLDELPLINRFARTARARGATVLSLSLDNDPRGIKRVPAVLRIRAPSLNMFVASFPDPDRFMSLFSRSWGGSIPALFAFDRSGKLQASLIGEVDPEELEALLARMSRSARRHRL